MLVNIEQASTNPTIAVLLRISDALGVGLPTLVEAEAHLNGRAPEDLEQIVRWQEAYRAFGAKPQRTRPSVEALLRRVSEGLPRVDRLTDTYNAVSVKHVLPIGGENLDAYSGPARLIRATGDEAFDTTKGGEPVVEHPEPGEVVWRDDLGVTCQTRTF